MTIEYISIFWAAFFSATIIPMASEFLILSASQIGNFDRLLLLIYASLGNILGSVINWMLGRYLWQFRHHKWFPGNVHVLDRASVWFNRFGVWSLLLAWLPIIGDPLTLIAGLLRVPFLIFVFLVSIGKTVRYALILHVVSIAVK